MKAKVKEVPQEETTCRYCGEPFSTRRPWQKFCSPEHRKQWNLEEVRSAREAYRQQQARG
jgi:hypothetical protein